MKIKDLRKKFVDELSTLYDKEEILSFFYILSEQFVGMRRVDVAIALEKELTDDKVSLFKKAKKQLSDYLPIQYIIGETEFYGLPFIVNQDVLIPRPETEELVDWIIKDCLSIEKGRAVKILDIGTGSGCISVSLAKRLPEAKVSAIDVSKKAIEVARQNAEQNNVSVEFILQDILAMDELKDSFDIIVSNPPYVRELEKQEIQPNVLDNEPHLALFVADNDPLVFYEKITDLAKKKLTSNGRLYFEINQYLGKETKIMIEERGFTSVVLRKDLYNNDRMIRADLNKI